MSAQVSNGLAKPDSTTGGSLQPRSAASRSSQIWNACVATVLTFATISRQRASRATISRATKGTAPTLTPSTTKSKSFVTRSVFAATRPRSPCDSNRRPLSASPSTSWRKSGSAGQHGTPLTSTSGRYSPSAISACTSNSNAST